MSRLVTERDASELLGVSVQTLQNRGLRGNGPQVVKLGHAVPSEAVAAASAAGATLPGVLLRGEVRTGVAMAQLGIEIVLMRQLASYLAVPILIVDRNLDLLFFNEPAAPILGRRFDETGQIQRGEWTRSFQPADEDGSQIEIEDHPLSVARLQQQPCHRRLVYQGLDGRKRRVEATAFPLLGQCARHLGAVGIFWEGA